MFFQNTKMLAAAVLTFAYLVNGTSTGNEQEDTKWELLSTPDMEPKDDYALPKVLLNRGFLTKNDINELRGILHSSTYDRFRPKDWGYSRSSFTVDATDPEQAGALIDVLNKLEKTSVIQPFLKL